LHRPMLRARAINPANVPVYRSWYASLDATIGSFFTSTRRNPSRSQCPPSRRRCWIRAFGVLGRACTGQHLPQQRLPFPEQCRIFEVWQPPAGRRGARTTMALQHGSALQDLHLHRSRPDPASALIRPGRLLVQPLGDPSFGRWARPLGGLHHAIIEGRLRLGVRVNQLSAGPTDRSEAADPALAFRWSRR